MQDGREFAGRVSQIVSHRSTPAQNDSHRPLRTDRMAPTAWHQLHHLTKGTSMDIQQLLAQIPADQLAARLGVDEQTAAAATAAAVPALVSGMQANAENPGGEASLAQALAQHADRPDVDVNTADPSDGQKIVDHVFGAQKDQVVHQLGGLGGIGGGLVAKVLPMLAPVVMGWLGNHLGKKSALSEADGQQESGGLSGMLGGLLGGGGGAAAGGLSSVLGGLLGGSGAGGAASSGGSTGGGLTNILGGLLGGGRKS